MSTLNKTASVAKSLYLGNIVEENLFPFPKISEAEGETLRMVLDSIDKFMQPKREDYRRFDAKGEQPEEYLNELRELGLFGLIIPEDFGGIGFSNASYSRVLQQTSRYDASTSLTIGAHSSIGMKGLLLFGTPEQKAKYLPKLATGEMIAAFCLTEPGAGSDAASIKTAAVKQADGSWLLNGDKLWITNGPLAQFFTVFARTDSSAGKISAFLVERDFGGVSHGPKEDKLGIRGSDTHTLMFQDVKVPKANRIGEDGFGFKFAMKTLSGGRIGIASQALGIASGAFELAVAYSKERKAFGKAICDHQAIQFKLADMATEIEAARLLCLKAAWLKDQHMDYDMAGSMAKLFASEVAMKTTVEAVQVHGGYGYVKEYHVERLMRDAKITQIYEGTSEVQRIVIGRGVTR